MKYSVTFEPFTDRHYIKGFEKKYKGTWDKTLKALTIEFTFANLLFEKSIAEIIAISPDNDTKICKTEFKILGTETSRHSSGNRCIIAIHESTGTVRVLLVYTKTDIPTSGKETEWWKKVVRENYLEYRDIL
jgi:hypothetical protein